MGPVALRTIVRVVTGPPPNQRMKLTARGGRVKRRVSFWAAAATGCSLCAFR